MLGRGTHIHPLSLTSCNLNIQGGGCSSLTLKLSQEKLWVRLSVWTDALNQKKKSCNLIQFREWERWAYRSELGISQRRALLSLEMNAWSSSERDGESFCLGYRWLAFSSRHLCRSLVFVFEVRLNRELDFDLGMIFQNWLWIDKFGKFWFLIHNFYSSCSHTRSKLFWWSQNKAQRTLI